MALADFTGSRMSTIVITNTSKSCMGEGYWAHVQIDAATGDTSAHFLADHLRDVSALAGPMLAGFGEPWSRLAGLWHDLGKYRGGFQTYIRRVNGHEAHLEGKLPSDSDKTHSAAGAVHALRLFEKTWGRSGSHVARLLAYVIAGHHAGLSNWTAGLDKRLEAGNRSTALEHEQALAACTVAAPELLELPAYFDLHAALATIPGVRSTNPLAWSLWIRMLFSSLVDADFLDTEAFLDKQRQLHRQTFEPIGWYLAQLDANLDQKVLTIAASGRAADPVMQARADVLQQCRAKALNAPGVFSLTVPTGGGKTLSSLAFALRHAQVHGKRRVIYAIPYTSIIEQTADVFTSIFGEGAVVEHHSQADVPDKDETARSRLACENWDAPLVVTTNVQLFESMFAARTSRCRKLHNLLNSVIVLDEAQLLPPEFLQPILDALNLLVAHYGVTLLLCTATQPALGEVRHFDPRRGLRGLPQPTPIIDDEAVLFEHLRRVRIEWPDDLHSPLDTDVLVRRLAEHECVLTIVNTRGDALDIVHALDAISGEKAIHLSAAMCGQHRANVIAEIRARLAARRAGADNRPLRVVSTQLVEAGVDIDFPVVYRALAGLDSIAQAAGRCNREGLLHEGRVVVFVRKLSPKLHQLRTGAEATRTVLAAGLSDALAPAAFERYFPAYYSACNSLDKHDIVKDLRDEPNPRLEFCFRDAARKFCLVDDADQATLIVAYENPHSNAAQAAPLIALLKQGDTNRWLLRKLQRFSVNVRQAQIDTWQARNDVTEIQPGLYLLTDPLRYDDRFGLMPEGEALSAGSLFL